MRKSTLLAILLIVACFLLGFSVSAQTPIKMSAKTEKPAFKNSQGFILPGTCADTTKVYQGTKGGLFYFKQSKTGKIYKVYLPKK